MMVRKALSHQEYLFTNEETRKVWGCLRAEVTGDDWAEERQCAKVAGRLLDDDPKGTKASEHLAELLYRKFSGNFRSTNIYWEEIARAALLSTNNED